MSFEALIAKLSPTLKRITRKLNGRFTFMDDQDLFQEALLHLWVNFAAGGLVDKTDSYMLQGCYYHLRNYIRKAQDGASFLSLSGQEEEDGPRFEETLATNNSAGYEQAESNLEVEAIVESGISQREKDVLLFSLEGMTTREIGVRLGVSHVSVVKTRSKLKERYESLYGVRNQTIAAPIIGNVEKRIVAGCQN